MLNRLFANLLNGTLGTQHSKYFSVVHCGYLILKPPTRVLEPQKSYVALTAISYDVQQFLVSNKMQSNKLQKQKANTPQNWVIFMRC